MKVLRVLIASLIVLTMTTGCNQESNKVEESTTTIGVSDYTSLKWSELPISMQEEYTSDKTKIELIGYLSSSISYDKSTAYLYNTHVDLSFKEFSGLDTASGVKMVSLSLKDNSIDGLQFVKVYGSVIKSKDTDVFGNSRSWRIVVDSIESVSVDSLTVAEYEKFAESDEYEALSNAVNYAGSVLYNSSKDGLTNDYEIVSAINGIAKNYPKVYEESEEFLNGMSKIVQKVESDEYTIGDSTEDYNNLVDYYSKFVEVLNKIGLLE